MGAIKKALETWDFEGRIGLPSFIAIQFRFNRF